MARNTKQIHYHFSKYVERKIGQIRKLQKDLDLEQTEFDGYSPEEFAEIDLGFDEDYLMEWYGTTV